MVRCLLIYDDPDLPEMDNLPLDEKVAFLRKTTDQNREVVRYAVINSDLKGTQQEKFLLWLMNTIIEDYHKEKQGEDPGEESDDRG